MARDGDATTFRVHGGGFIIGRVSNEFGIARTVATAIKDAYTSNGNADGCQRNLGPPCRNSRGPGDWRGDYDDYAEQDTANVAWREQARAEGDPSGPLPLLELPGDITGRQGAHPARQRRG